MVAAEDVTRYLTTSLLERRHQPYPKCPVVNNGGDWFAAGFVAWLIRVPRFEITGWRVGPIWFTERPDQGFHHTGTTSREGCRQVLSAAFG
ncbi:hypothetical protein PY254_09275 [Rhodanobacter sp. AS-Z3]|uniref:hypothetical protein n=1 Tax=Rhodanobacter sp. AS-Z3 TaxID=3031330 RepID=UPI0024785328|nr:hypothetical protein [Rhodanobacter sp. AS-Z3]WEN13465.1 hypothetical protein PY254_09275 [Rhodanobacter sp. AS-Z3]